MPKKNSKAAYPLHQSPFYFLRTKRRLAELLGLNIRQLEKLSEAESSYFEWDDVNAKGKVRHIENPKPQLKRVQRRIADLLSRIAPPDFLFCPVKGRSYISNARAHAGNRVVRSLDVKSYFPSTPSRRVYWFFHTWMGCAPDVAGILTRLSTFKGRLPTGSPLSPIMAYFSYVDMWEEIGQVARSAGCVVSVYIDDVTVSGDDVPEGVIWKIKQKIHGAGLRYHKEKTFRGRKAEITGVVIVDGQLRAPNRQHLTIHKLQLELAETADPELAVSLKRKIDGRRAQVRQVTHMPGK